MTCQSCTVSSLCSSCQLSSPAVPERKVLEAWRILEQSRSTGSDDDDSEEESELEDNASESEDDLGSDTSENDEGSGDFENEEEEVDLTDPGSIVWVCWGSRWYPAKVVLLAEVPECIRNTMRKDSGRSVVVKFFGDEDYARVDIKKIDELGMTNLDLRRSRNPGVMLKYNMALADVKYKGGL